MGANLGDLGHFSDGEHVVSVFPDVPSLTRPDWLSVVSEPVADHIDFYKLWCGVIKALKTGRKWSKLEIELPRFFLVGQLAQRSDFPATPATVRTHALSPAGQDCIGVNYLHHLDRQQRTIRCEAVVDGHFVGREYFVLHEVPELCLEAWQESPGSRFAGEWLRAVTQATLDLILDRVVPGERKKIWVYQNVEEPANSGLMSVVSDPLDHLLDFDRIWNEWLDLLKYPNNRGGPVKEVKLKILSELEFSILQVVDGAEAMRLWCGADKPGEWVRDFKKVNAHKEMRALYIEHFLQSADTTPRRYWIRFSDKPELRVLCWGETPGKRDAGEDFAKRVEVMLNSVLTAPEELEAGPIG